MSFGFGAADLKGAIKFCNWMRENCIDKDGTADERYRRFKNSVKGLHDQVVRLQSVIETSLAERPYDPDSKADQDLQREFKDVAGDCIQTIQKCDKLLKSKSHVKLDKTRAGIIKNITWGAMVQSDVDKLISQLQFHIQRLQILLAPVPVGDITIIKQIVSELLMNSRGQNPELIRQASDLVPGWLNNVFDANSRINAPLGLADISEIGVKEGCDLLYRLFSTRNSHDSSLDARECAVRRYLNILKCQWLINTLRETRGFQQHRPGSAFSMFISNIEVSLCHDLQTITRTAGAGVSDQDLRHFFVRADNLKPFLIWDPPTLRRLRSPTEREVGEEYILTVRLASNGPKEELLFFKKGRTDFRLVPTEEVDGKTRLSPYMKEERFNLLVDKLVPRYAVGRAGIPGPIPMDLYLHGHTNPVTYHMKDLQDAWAFQRAITGYEVVGNECNIRWTAQEKPSVRKIWADSRRVELQGCVQVWRWDPYSETIPTPGPDNRASVDSPDSSESGTITLSPVSIAPSQRTVNSFSKTESTIHGGVLEQLQPPTAPVLAAFGISGGFYRCYVIQLRSNLIIERRACQCTSEGDGGDCKVLVIQSARSSGETFDVQTLSVPEDSIKNWNLAVFRGPGRSAEAKNPAIVKHLSCEKLRLDFKTAKERMYFSDAFMVATGEYIEALSEYEEYKQQLKLEGDHPRGPSRTSVYESPASSVATVAGAAPGVYAPVPNTVPKLPPVAAVSRFSLGVLGEEK
ncbi:hypothetical protein QBC39DRAFT_331997 [Podospora conica]|nr:hypothetical protein QBC39DRAFT_331997 [Schizothecium conicum]